MLLVAVFGGRGQGDFLEPIGGRARRSGGSHVNTAIRIVRNAISGGREEIRRS